MSRGNAIIYAATEGANKGVDVLSSRKSAKFPETEPQLRKDLEEGRVYRLLDSVFKFVFCKDEQISLFLDMVNAFVFPEGKRAFQSARLIDREQSPRRKKGKSGRLDVAAIMDGGEQVNMEAQAKYASDFLKRSVGYWSVFHGGQLNRGDPYWKIAPTISVNLLGYNQFRGRGASDFWNSFSIQNDKDGKKLNNDFQMIFLEIPKYVKNCKTPHNSLERWMAYFAGTGGREMEQIAKQEPMIAAALEREKLFMADRDQRIAYILDWKLAMDEANRESRLREAETQRRQAEEKIRQAEEKSRQDEEKVRQEAIMRRQAEEKSRQDEEKLRQSEEKLLKAAQIFLEGGMAPEKVAEACGLPLEEVLRHVK
ncbi:MAG: Rpn family recombination-promoting nuclease/putative transposase [Synergistaceae bacterium]|jgi:predicted transposase/invertase (TIGR01784 family)|nr:Rpn family recombination-promoting nuclease/putative transposase [Synergistaceae bacterium]